MNLRSTVLGSLLAALLSATVASAAVPKRSPGEAARPSLADEAARGELKKAVKRQLSEARLGAALGSYTVSASLVQLRRYIDTDAPKLICVVDLALRDARGQLVASVRGNASATNALAKDVIDAAAHAAVQRLPQALQAARERQKKNAEVAER